MLRIHNELDPKRIFRIQTNQRIEIQVRLENEVNKALIVLVL